MDTECCRNSLVGHSNNSDNISEQDSVTQVKIESVPARQLAARKAKENKVKYHISDDSDSDTYTLIQKLGEKSDDDEPYDSDRDPAWTPFGIEKKAPPFDVTDPAGKRKKRTVRRMSAKSRKSSSEHLIAGQLGSSVERAVEVNSDDSDDEQQAAIPPVTKELQVGEFVMDKKDLKNMECYPIWKIESGRMLHKFELFTKNRKILHKSIPTFSSWLPNMRGNFIHIQVRTVFKQGDKEHVEVLDEYRPKPVLDSKLEQKYEEHPLVNAFNVYLQIFLSQALEPGFLSAIKEANERFYLDALDKIDAVVEKQLGEIDAKVKWVKKFKQAVKLHPHIRELNRPNLKLACQACEFANQPAIKSVHLFGNAYDRFTLQELLSGGSRSSQEFLVGRTAAKFVKPYHNLYHFKYNIFKRCQAKVSILQDANAGDNAGILDQCLQNRTWVLQIFEDFKKLLENG